MPIKDLLERPVSTPALQLFPRLAWVNKGSPKRTIQRDGKPFKISGQDLDYFRIEFMAGYAHLAASFEQMYGPQPKVFTNVMLAGSTLDEAFPTWYEERGAVNTSRRCDGITQVGWRENDKWVEGERPCARANGGRCGCRQKGYLHFYLPDFTLATGYVGYFSIATGAWRDLRRIYELLKSFEERGIPLNSLRLVLGRREEDMDVPMKDKETGEMKTVRQQRWMLYMTLDPVSAPLLFDQPLLAAPGTVALSDTATPALPAGSVATTTSTNGTTPPPVVRAGDGEETIAGDYDLEDDEEPGTDDVSHSDPPTSTAPATGTNGIGTPPPPNGWDGNWKAGSAAKLIPAIRQATGINPPDLFDVLTELGSKAHPGLSVEHIAALVLGGEVTLQDAEPGDADDPPDPWAAYKQRTDPLEPDTYADLVTHLQARYGGEQAGQPVSSSQTRRIAMLVNAAFDADTKADPDEDDAAKAARKAAKDQAEEARHALTQFCFGKEGASKLDADEALALILALSGDDPARSHTCAAEELTAITAQVAALQDVPPATPKGTANGKPKHSATFTPKPRKPSDLQVIYLAGLTFEDMEIADEQRRQAVWGWMKQAIKARNPKRKPGELDTDIRAALQYFTGDSEGIKNLTGDHVVALGHILDSAPDDATLGAELLLCAAGARLNPTEEPTAGDAE